MSIFDTIAKFIAGDPPEIFEKKSPAKHKEKTDKQKPEVAEKKSKKSSAKTATGKKAPAKKTPKETETTQTGTEELKGSNIIDTINKLQQKIISVIKKNFDGGHYSFDNKKLILWVKDNLLYNALSSDPEFSSNLITAIYNECGISIPQMEIKTGRIPNDVRAIATDIYIQLQEDTPYHPVHTATIKALPNNGSLLEEVYHLSADEISNLPGKRYNIGIGSQPRLDNNCIRTNHIAIDDNDGSPEFEHNRYVSRAHAHISYDSRSGFLLYVEDGGTSLNSKRTAIFRNEREIRLESIHAPQPLQDGDIIVLSKNVYLIFNEKKK